MMRRLPVVGVMGSGTTEHAGLAGPLGRALARMDVHLLTGGGGGVMAAASRAFAEVDGRAGLVVGVLPGRVGLEDVPDAPPSRAGVADRSCETPPGYPNPWVELEIRTHLDARGGSGDAPASRNHVNVLSSDVVVALPGGEGTASEIALAMRYGRPLALFGRDEKIGDEMKMGDEMRAGETLADQTLAAEAIAGGGAVAVASTLEEVVAFVRRWLPNLADKG